MDPWYSMGKADLVDAAHLALHFTYMSGREEIAEMLRCATERGARTLGVEDEYGIEEGKPADCVVFDAPDALEVIRLRATRRWVIRRGQVIAETTPAQTTLLGEPVTFTAVTRSPWAVLALALLDGAIGAQLLAAALVARRAPRRPRALLRLLRDHLPVQGSRRGDGACRR